MKRPIAGDALGALAASTVLLPQAMAFRTAVFAAAGLGPAAGALAGLLAAASISLVSGLVGGATGLVSAPNGPTFALLSGAVATIAATGLDGPATLAAMAMILVLAGAATVVLGFVRGGDLMKFVPYPVVAGFMTGSAILMVKSQLPPLSGGGAGGEWGAWRFLPAAVAALTFVVTAVAPRVVSFVPGPLAGLVAGTAAFHGLVALGPPAPLPAGWVVGALPPPSAMSFGFELGSLASVPWGRVVPAALALAVLASLNALLASVVADSLTGARHDARRQLVGQGLGQALSGLLGGIAGSGTTGATVIAVRAGGRSHVAVACSALLVLVVLALGPLTAWLPLSVLAGIVLHVAVFGTVERDIIAWLRRRSSVMDGATAVLVTVVTVAADLASAVGVGVGLAVLRFVRDEVRSPVIHRRSTAAEHPSLRRRTAAERILLSERGGDIVIAELQGNLFFGTADRLFSDLAPDLERPAHVILEMGRVAHVDLTGLRVLEQVRRRAKGHGGELSFANVHSRLGLGRDVQAALDAISLRAPSSPILTFIDADEALEHAEDLLLARAGAAPSPDEALELESFELARDLDPEDLAALGSVLGRRSAKAGEILFETGDEGRELFFVRRGIVDARLPTTTRHYKRVGSFGPGTFFGEVAFLERKARTAHAVVRRDAELLVLDPDGLARLAAGRPRAAIGVLHALSRELAGRLRAADVELQRLAGW